MKINIRKTGLGNNKLQSSNFYKLDNISDSMNRSKINDERFWNKWRNSGAVGNYETACLSCKDFDKTTRPYLVTKVSELENGVELNFKDSPVTLSLRFNETDLLSSRPDLAKKIQENDTLLLEGFEGNEPLHFWGIRTVKGIYQTSSQGNLPTPIYVREF